MDTEKVTYTEDEKKVIKLLYIKLLQRKKEFEEFMQTMGINYYEL